MIDDLGLPSTIRNRRLASPSGLHNRGHGDAHDGESANQFAPNDRDRSKQELFSPLIGLAEDGMAVIEGVEELRQSESVLGEVGRFCSRDTLVHKI